MPKQVDHDERRRQLTEALLRIAGTRGLQAVSMREIAAEAGVSLRVVQYYFTNKQALLESGLTELGARMDRRVRQRAAATAGELTPRGVFTAVLGTILPFDEQSRLDSHPPGPPTTPPPSPTRRSPRSGSPCPTRWKTSSPYG